MEALRNPRIESKNLIRSLKASNTPATSMFDPFRVGCWIIANLGFHSQSLVAPQAIIFVAFSDKSHVATDAFQ